MKRILILTLALVLLLGLVATPVMAGKGDKKADCTTITHGEVCYSSSHYLAGQPIPTGYDVYGYSYNGHMFKGLYTNSYLGGYGFPPYESDDEAYYQRLIDEEYAESVEEAVSLMNSVWCWPYRDVKLSMKWNDAWISNKSCDGDLLLDRHYGYATYIGSGAWLTNHQSGTYEDGTRWNYFVKIVAVPADAYREIIIIKYDEEGPIYGPGPIWYTAGGTEIGPVIWGDFAIIQQVENDPVVGVHGLQYISPNNAGFGSYAP